MLVEIIKKLSMVEKMKKHFLVVVATTLVGLTVNLCCMQEEVRAHGVAEDAAAAEGPIVVDDSVVAGDLDRGRTTERSESQDLHRSTSPFGAALALVRKNPRMAGPGDAARRARKIGIKQTYAFVPMGEYKAKQQEYRDRDEARLVFELKRSDAEQSTGAPETSQRVLFGLDSEK